MKKLAVVDCKVCVPWGWNYTAGTVSDWVAQFSFGFYSLMLTSAIIGFAVNVLFSPITGAASAPWVLWSR